jgi:hypothetical protein
MVRLSRAIQPLVPCVVMRCTRLLEAARFLRCCLRSPAALAAEHLFLRKQLALYQARHLKPRHVTNAMRVALVWRSPWFAWQPAPAVIPPEPVERWRCHGCYLCWQDTSCPGRPAIPVERQRLLRQMARDHLTRGQRRIPNALQLTLGLQVSPRTVRTYVPNGLAPSPGHHVPSPRWRTFMRHHAQALIVHGLAVDLLTRGAQAVSARIRRLWHHWWGRSVTRGVQGTSQGYAGTIPLLRAIISVPPVWTADTGAVIRVDQRSPPDGGPSCTHDPGLASQATSVNRFDGCPAGAGRCGGQRAGPHTRGAKPLSTGKSRVVPWPRAA